MARLSSTNPFLFIGKPVKDEYGRQIGRVASFMVSPNGRVKGVFVEHGNGEFFHYPSNHFRTDDNDVVLMSPTNLRARTLCEEMPLIYRKDQALSGLLEKKRISSEMFNSIHKSFENALNQLKTDAQNILENLDKHVVRCNQQIKELRLAMLHLEIEHEIDKIDEKSYQTSMEMIQEGLKRAEAEKSDLEATRNKLSNMLSGRKAQTETESALMLPEPPVVVHVKNLSKPGS